MKHCLILSLLALSLLPGGNAPPPTLLASPASATAPQEETAAQPAFRVRADFGADLNADEGWAGALNEDVTVRADEPFRLRFEVEPGRVGSGQYALQYRRNQGAWTHVEAHDFPHPVRDHEVDIANVEAGMTPTGWTILQGRAAGLTVAGEGPDRVLRAAAGPEPLVALYAPPWETGEFTVAAELRLPAASTRGAGLVLGYADGGNYCLVFIDVAAGAIRVSRFVDGQETHVTERQARIVPGQWLALEFEYQDGELDVTFQDEELEFTARLGAGVPPSGPGLHVPANSTAEFRAVRIEGDPRTPRVSIVACPAYENGAATTNLLGGSAARFEAGTGISLAERTPSWAGAGAHGEFEWALVVRRYADGAVSNEEGDTFEFRMVTAGEAARTHGRSPVLRLTIPPGHVGGTFVETPGRIGPWQASNGDLYFVMEPAETENVFMMIKSSDSGRTWHEVDGANRPRTNDLESVDGRQAGHTIHLIHQVTRSTVYHSFHTSDHPTHPDTWGVRDERAAAATSVAQAASLVVRSDGSMVTFYVGQTIHYSIRSASGAWSAETIMDEGSGPGLAGPQAVLGVNDTVHLAYYGTDGTIWYRRLLLDGTLTERQPLASGAGATRAEFGSVLPLIFIPRTNTVVVLYRLADGRLWDRRIVNDGALTAAVMVTDRDVAHDAVDSQQPAADAVLDDETVHVLFADQSSRSLLSTHDRGGWQPSTVRVENIRASWVRGNVYTRPDGVTVYGYVYDAGSEGGAGMNRFGEIVLRGP